METEIKSQEKKIVNEKPTEDVNDSWQLRGIKRTKELLRYELALVKEEKPETYPGAIEKLKKIINLYYLDLGECPPHFAN